MYFRINDSQIVVTSHPKRASLFGFVYLLENVEGGKLREKKNNKILEQHVNQNVSTMKKLRICRHLNFIICSKQADFY